MVLAETVQPFVCGGLAACFASSCIHPIDLAKVRIQLMSTLRPDAPKISFPTLIMNMVREEGVTSIYAGLSAALMRQAIYGTARIGLHRTFSDKLQEMNKGQEIPFYMKTLSGMGSGAVAVAIGTPFDVALVRMQSDSMKPKADRRNYNNVFDALRRCAAEEGAGALYAGLAPNILRGMSMNVGMMACYDQAKTVMARLLGDAPDARAPSLPVKLSSSAIAGFTAAAFSLPFDMLKSRLQDQRPDASGKLRYAGLLDCAASVARKEGVLAFWTGFGAYYGRCAPHAMLILLSIEQVTQTYRRVLGLS
ncbi:oxoglutarate/malate translocator [Tribonema minus]|uniref:Oxoglutarate/malate translocator n=1 Tax=Tribonema minus TaxID=303371 RepID=A0A835YQA6_9STRA|nr:oxoglutarate/malate translocator [Tribonema minus]